MKRTLHTAFASVAMIALIGHQAKAQRYLNEVFTNAQLTITPDVHYGVNIDFLTSDFSDISIAGPEIVQLQTLVSTSQPIPPEYFNPNDTTTVVKVADLRMDVYEPSHVDDAVAQRPVLIYLHTGNALPPPLNGSPNGTRKDSTCVEICKRMARRGYVAISISYRLGWNPLGATLQERTGTLLNAIYRAINDVKQCVRSLKENAAGTNDYHLDANKVILFGEGTGGYISLATATLNHVAELYIPKFIPDPFQPTVSYVDTTRDGNIDGFGGQLNLARPNGFSSNTNFCVNMGGSLADSSWLEPGDVPMVAFHTVFDPFAPFTEGIVIVPTTSEQVVEVVGSNYFMRNVNAYGNNDAFATLPSGDIWTSRARALYGSNQVHAGSTVHINTGVEGLYPVVTTDWPGMAVAPYEEASPWQWWDPNSAIASVVVAPPNITANQASLASNPNSSPAKGRAMIDTVMGYLNPRIVCALQLGPCSLVGIDENDPIAVGVDVFPNPAHDRVTVTSKNEVIRMFELYDADGRRVRAENVENGSFTMQRKGLQPGAYFITLQFDKGTVTKKLMLD